MAVVLEGVTDVLAVVTVVLEGVTDVLAVVTVVLEGVADVLAVVTGFVVADVAALLEVTIVTLDVVPDAK